MISCVPLTPETDKMFGDDAFKKMKKTSVFVNIGRGKTVDTDALVRALKSQTIFAAGLDVTEPEPLPVDHELLKLPNAGEHEYLIAVIQRDDEIDESNTLQLVSCNVSVDSAYYIFTHSHIIINKYTKTIKFILLFTVVIPHMGSKTVETRNDVALVAAQNILNCFDGKPLLHEL